MDFQFINDFLEDFDISTLLPDLGSLLGKVDLVLRIAVLLAPLVILGLGLLYFLTPPKEANHNFGYRFYWGMSSVESWLFTQKLAGAIWSILGFGLLVVMAVLCGSFKGMEAMAMVQRAFTLILWELGLVAISCVIIDLTVIVFFNSKGIRRNFTRKGVLSEETEEFYDDDEFYDELEEEEEDQ